MLRRRYILTILALWLMSCDGTKVGQQDGLLMCKVSKSSGDDFSYTKGEQIFHFAPYPFNVGTLASSPVDEVMVLSKKLPVGREIAVQPLAQLAVRESDGGRKRVLFVVPEVEDLRLFETGDYSTFTVDHFALKQYIEYWYQNRYGLQGTITEGWGPLSTEDIL